MNDKIMTTTKEWLSPENPHNVDSLKEYIDNVKSAIKEASEFVETAADEIKAQFKIDLETLIAKLEEIIEKF